MSWYPLQSSHSRSWVTVGKKRRTQTPLHADFKLGLQVYLLTTSHKCFSMQATVVVAWASVTTLLNKQLVVKTTNAVAIYDLHGQRKFQLHVQYVCTILMAKFRSHVLYVYPSVLEKNKLYFGLMQNHISFQCRWRHVGLMVQMYSC